MTTNTNTISPIGQHLLQIFYLHAKYGYTELLAAWVDPETKSVMVKIRAMSKKSVLRELVVVVPDEAMAVLMERFEDLKSEITLKRMLV